MNKKLDPPEGVQQAIKQLENIYSKGFTMIKKFGSIGKTLIENDDECGLSKLVEKISIERADWSTLVIVFCYETFSSNWRQQHFLAIYPIIGSKESIFNIFSNEMLYWQALLDRCDPIRSALLHQDEIRRELTETIEHSDNSHVFTKDESLIPFLTLKDDGLFELDKSKPTIPLVKSDGYFSMVRILMENCRVRQEVSQKEANFLTKEEIAKKISVDTKVATVSRYLRKFKKELKLYKLPGIVRVDSRLRKYTLHNQLEFALIFLT